MHRCYWAVLIFAFGCACSNSVSTRPDRDDLPDTLQALLQEAIDDSFESVPGISMCVIAPELDLHWQGAAGYDSAKRDDSLSVEQPFRVASITKTFVAASLLRLQEEGQLALDDPISAYISAPHDSLLRHEGYRPDSITWRQVLHHTSGLYDYAMSGPTYVQLARRDPQHRWTRTEQLALAMDIGTPVKPSTAYHYSDTGYILAGEAIERTQDTTLAAGLRQLLNFKKLNLNSTWLESLEPAPTNHLPVVHRYLGKDDVTEWDASIDLYGGGGLVSTCNDLASFMHGLFNHQVFQQEETLTTMLSKADLPDSYDKEGDKRYKDYRLGLWHAEVFGMDTYLHGGLWGIGLIHVPKLNLTIAVNCTDGSWQRVSQKTILVIKNLQEKLKTD